MEPRHLSLPGSDRLAALALNKDGDIFYAENRGGWVGSGGITHVERGDFWATPKAGNGRAYRLSVKLTAADVPHR